MFTHCAKLTFEDGTIREVWARCPDEWSIDQLQYPRGPFKKPIASCEVRELTVKELIEDLENKE